MDQTAIIAIVVGVLLLGAVAWYLWQRQRSIQLRERYGREYDRTIHETGDRRKAEAELVRREKRVEHLDIRALEPEERNRFIEDWRVVQTKFVDAPKEAVIEADRLVEEVMRERGYPVTDFEQRAADLSVHHAGFVDNYRAARDIAVRHRRGEASTEDLRQAMVHYRELFADLLEDHEHAHVEARR